MGLDKAIMPTILKIEVVVMQWFTGFSRRTGS
jgi:hypothetical protein